jgi:hypothetical protein
MKLQISDCRFQIGFQIEFQIDQQSAIDLQSEICNLQSAICKFSSLLSLYRPMIDDADDPGIDRRLSGIERKAGFLAAHEEHLFADACADGIRRDERPAHRLMLGRQRLDDEELDADQPVVFAGRDHFANDTGQLHMNTQIVDFRLQIAD